MSISMYIAALALIIALFGLYLFFFLRRAGRFYLQGVKSAYITLGALLLAAIFAITAVTSRGLLLLFVLSVIGFGLITDLINLIIKTLSKAVHKSPAFWQKLYRCGLIPVLVTVITMTAGYFNMISIRRTDYTVDTAKLRQDYRIALITDLHFGTTMDAEKLQKIAEEISESSPDLVILGGDIVDESTTKEKMQAAFQALGSITNQYGCFYIYGNHDIQTYASEKYFTGAELRQAIESAGITILEDELYPVNNELLLIGRNDFSRSRGQRKSIEELTAGMSEDLFRLVLDHQPRDTEACSTAGCDLQLSGHTHNGQIWPAGYISSRVNDFLYGQNTLNGYQVIVSSGIAGWGFPVRTEGHSEWVMVTLHAQP